jgi:predicted AlkP superfamily phosphohydrolase/phosphomutase
MTTERRITHRSPRRVLLVGWDAADWQIIQPLVASGLMPTTASFLERGGWGNLSPTRPILSPILWNTIATGKRADAHGVCGFTEPVPDGPGIRPVASTSRTCKALWNVLTQCGLRSNVVGWYASHPAEPILGAMVSNQFDAASGGAPAVGSVHPPELAAELAGCLVAAAEIDAPAILPFVPTAAERVAAGDRRIGTLQHMLAQTATVHAVATHLMAHTEWDFMAVYFEGIDRFGHEFMAFHPPRMPQVSAEEFEAYRHCMTGIYRFHDMLLETLLALAGDDTAVIVVSDHGYYNDEMRPDPRPGRSGPVDWHRPFGIFAAAGPGVRRGARLYGASILDVAPTVLELLGLPAAADMPGRVLVEALDGAEGGGPIERIASWERVAGACGMHPPELQIDPAGSRAALEQLVALGYIDAPSADDERTRRETTAANGIQLAQALADGGRFAAAIELLRGIDESVRGTTAVRILLASCLLALGDGAAAADELGRLDPADHDLPGVQLMLGSIDFAAGRLAEALERLSRVAAAEPRLPGVHNRLGEVLLSMGRHAEATDSFTRALAIDAESPASFAGLARAWLERGDPQRAVNFGLRATALVHHFPAAHLAIGRALGQLGDRAGAIEALDLCVRQAPHWTQALDALAAAQSAATPGGAAEGQGT